jgi:hypothetical protein
MNGLWPKSSAFLNSLVEIERSAAVPLEACLLLGFSKDAVAITGKSIAAHAFWRSL